MKKISAVFAAVALLFSACGEKQAGVSSGELAEMDDLSGLSRDEIEALLSRTEGYPENVQAMAAKIRFDLQRLEYLS